MKAKIVKTQSNRGQLKCCLPSVQNTFFLTVNEEKGHLRGPHINGISSMVYRNHPGTGPYSVIIGKTPIHPNLHKIDAEKNDKRRDKHGRGDCHGNHHVFLSALEVFNDLN